LAAILVSGGLATTFSTGLLQTVPVELDRFLFAVSVGVFGWVILASKAGLPVSTTHAMTGAILGTALVMGGFAAVRWPLLGMTVFLPLVLSPLLAGALLHLHGGAVDSSRSNRGNRQCSGLRGGSSLDCAKGINFVLSNGGTMQDYRGFGKASRPMLPSIGIPTTAGTGSEAQSYALISDAGTHAKMACGDPKAAFRIAILDPVLTVTQPRAVAATAGYDAISHAV
jgi:hypothetical protein